MIIWMKKCTKFPLPHTMKFYNCHNATECHMVGEEWSIIFPNDGLVAKGKGVLL